MPVVRILLILVLCALPRAAAAQPWADAYRTGDYQKAADLLHLLVVDQESLLTSGDPGPARQLAVLYAQGQGVVRDPIAACALAQMAQMTMHMAELKTAQNILDHQAAIEDSDQFAQQHCNGLSQEDRLAASASTGCFAFGMPEASLTVGRHSVRVGRGGIHLAVAPGEGVPSNLGCPQLVARLRPLTVAPPPDAAPGVKARHFVEFVAWHIGRDADSTVKSSLQWQVYEVQREKLEVVAMEYLFSIGGWPQPALAPEFDARFNVEMIRSGHVRWRMEGAPPKRGWIMLPEGESR